MSTAAEPAREQSLFDLMPRERATEVVAQAALVGALGSIPIFGSAAVSPFEAAMNLASAREREKWLGLLALEVERLALRQDQSIDELITDPQFVAAIIRGTRLASETANEEKRRMLSTGICNSGSWSQTPEFVRHHLLGLVGELQPEHIEVLAMLDNPRTAVAELNLPPQISLAHALQQTVLRDVQDAALKYGIITRDLHDRHLTSMMPGMGWSMDPSQNSTTMPLTELGDELLTFVGNSRFVPQPTR